MNWTTRMMVALCNERDAHYDPTGDPCDTREQWEAAQLRIARIEFAIRYLRMRPY